MSGTARRPSRGCLQGKSTSTPGGNRDTQSDERPPGRCHLFGADFILILLCLGYISGILRTPHIVHSRSALPEALVTLRASQPDQERVRVGLSKAVQSEAGLSKAVQSEAGLSKYIYIFCNPARRMSTREAPADAKRCQCSAGGPPARDCQRV